jgi:hypothetical protein
MSKDAVPLRLYVSADGHLRHGGPSDRDHGRARRGDPPNDRVRSRPPEGEHSNEAIDRPPEGEVLPSQTG